MSSIAPDYRRLETEGLKTMTTPPDRGQNNSLKPLILTSVPLTSTLVPPSRVITPSHCDSGVFYLSHSFSSL